MDNSSINKLKMFVDSKQKEKVCEEKRHQPHTPEKSQQPGHTTRTKCTSSKKNPVSSKSKDEDVPDGIPLKPVSVKRILNPRLGHKEDCHRLTNGATGVHTLQHLRGDPDQLPDEQRRLAYAIHDKQLLLQEKLLRTAQVLRNIQDRESSETGSREPGRRRDVDMRTEGRAGNTQEGKRDKWDTQEGKRMEKIPPGRPRREEQPSDYGTGGSGHLSRRADEGVGVMKSNSDKERSKRSSVQSSAKTRGESQWGQARANEKEEAQQGRERSSVEGHGSRGEKEQVGQRQPGPGHSAEGHIGRERPHPLQSGRPKGEVPIPENAEARPQLLPCKYCKRNFFPASLEKHLPICERLHQSSTRRKAYDSSKHRTKGTDMEQFRQHNSETGSSDVGISSDALLMFHICSHLLKLILSVCSFLG